METKDIIYKKLKALTKQKFTDASSVREIGIDSLDLVELITDAEAELEIRISDEDLEAIKTVGDIVKTIEKLVKK